MGIGGSHLKLTCPLASWAFIKRIREGKRKGPPDFAKWAFHTGEIPLHHSFSLSLEPPGSVYTLFDVPPLPLARHCH